MKTIWCMDVIDAIFNIKIKTEFEKYVIFIHFEINLQ